MCKKFLTYIRNKTIYMSMFQVYISFIICPQFYQMKKKNKKLANDIKFEEFKKAFRGDQN